MIYVTGDTHGDRYRFSPSCMAGEGGFGAGDVVIVCGDFGYVLTCDYGEKKWLDALSRKPYTVCFVDGNHENFPEIFKYPEEEWCGGKIHRIRQNVIHLMRGQVYEIEGKKFFTMGGAFSTDREFRELGKTYWEEEIPTQQECDEAIKNLARAKMSVDYVITHNAPLSAIMELGYTPAEEDKNLADFLEWVLEIIDYKKWYFGHWHKDKELARGLRAIYYDVEQIGE